MDTGLIREGPTLRTLSPPKDPPPNTITVGVRISTQEFSGDASIQSIIGRKQYLTQNTRNRRSVRFNFTKLFELLSNHTYDKFHLEKNHRLGEELRKSYDQWRIHSRIFKEFLYTSIFSKVNQPERKMGKCHVIHRTGICSGKYVQPQQEQRDTILYYFASPLRASTSRDVGTLITRCWGGKLAETNIWEAVPSAQPFHFRVCTHMFTQWCPWSCVWRWKVRNSWNVHCRNMEEGAMGFSYDRIGSRAHAGPLPGLAQARAEKNGFYIIKGL